MRLMPLTVAMTSSAGRVIWRSTSSGVEPGYGTLITRNGKSNDGNNSSGIYRDEIAPIMMSETNTINVVTGRRMAVLVRFIACRGR